MKAYTDWKEQDGGHYLYAVDNQADCLASIHYVPHDTNSNHYEWSVFVIWHMGESRTLADAKQRVKNELQNNGWCYATEQIKRAIALL